MRIFDILILYPIVTVGVIVICLSLMSRDQFPRRGFSVSG